MKIGGKDMYFLMTAATGSKQALERTLEGFRGFTSRSGDGRATPWAQ
jgi:hypothetical protein